MATLEVIVPDGLVAGDTFAVTTADGIEFDVIVPEACGSGALLEVDRPVGAGPAAETMLITVPDAVGPGDTISVSAQGRCFDVIVPDGVGPGDELEVSVPAEPVRSPVSPSKAARQQLAAETTSIAVGQEVEVSGQDRIRSLATVVEEIHGAELLYRVRLAGSGLLRTVSEYDVKILRSSLFVGREVNVRRSDGQRSEGHIIEIIDGYQVMYNVRIPDGSAHGFGSITKMCAYDDIEVDSDEEDNCWEEDDDETVDQQLGELLQSLP